MKRPTVLRVSVVLVLVLALALVLGGAASVIAADGPTNVLLICIDDLRPELGCYGRQYISSPNIDALARSGRAFHRHYVQAPTCGASRYTLLTGTYGGPSNSALFERADRIRQNPASVPASLPGWFRQHGYATVSVGKVSHHPGGRGGPNWDQNSIAEMPRSWDRHLMPSGPWQHPRGAMHGLADGEIRGNAKQMDVFQSAEGPDTAYPDGWIVDEAIRQLDQLSEDDGKPFLLAVGIIRPHLPFGAPAKYMRPYRDVSLPPIPHPHKPEHRTTWHRSGEFMKYNRWGHDPNVDAEFADQVRRHYAACVSYADAQVGRVLDHLGALGKRNDTVVVLWGDHGWHLGEHAIWGKHALFEESLRSPLIVQFEGIPQPGEASDSVVETLDLFPTLCELAGLPIPAFVDGISLGPMLNDPQAAGHDAYSYQGGARTIRTATHRLIEHRDGYVELYDHQRDSGETQNVAEQMPERVRELRARISARLR